LDVQAKTNVSAHINEMLREPILLKLLIEPDRSSMVHN